MNMSPPTDEDPTPPKAGFTLADGLGWTSLALSPLGWIGTLRFGLHLLLGVFGSENGPAAQAGLDAGALLVLLAGGGLLLGLTSLCLGAFDASGAGKPLWRQPALYALAIDAIPAAIWMAMLSRR